MPQGKRRVGSMHPLCYHCANHGTHQHAPHRSCPRRFPCSLKPFGLQQMFRADIRGAGVQRQTGDPLTSAALPPVQKRQLLEQGHILFVLEQGTVQRRDELAGVALTQHVHADILRYQQLQPVQQFRC